MNNLLIVAEWTPNFKEHFAPLVERLKNHHGEQFIAGLFYVSKYSTDSLDIAEYATEPFDKLFLVHSGVEFRKTVSTFHSLLATYLFIKPSSGYLSGPSGDLELYQISRKVIPDAVILLRTLGSLDRHLQGDASTEEALNCIKRLKKRDSAIFIKIRLIYFCFIILSAVVRCIKQFKKKSKRHKILFIRLDALGDMVLSLPAILALREHYPLSEITLLVSKRSGAIIEEQQQIATGRFCDRLIFWDAPWNEDRENLQGVKAFLRIVSMLPLLLRERYDVVIQPVELGTGILFASLFCADTTVATVAERLPLARLMEKHLVPARFSYYESHHIAVLPDRSVSSLVPSGLTDKYLHDCIRIDSNDTEFIKRELLLRGWDGAQKIVSINLGAGHQRRKWGPQNYAKLIEIMRQESFVLPVVIGGSAELELGRAVQELLGVPAVSFVGKLGLNQLAALLSVSDVLVTPDTGVMHMAAALDKKIIAIFGAGLVPFCHPLCSDYIIVKQELGCSGCNDVCFTSGTPPCIAEVTVEMVLEAFYRLLASISSPPTHSLNSLTGGKRFVDEIEKR